MTVYFYLQGRKCLVYHRETMGSTPCLHFFKYTNFWLIDALDSWNYVRLSKELLLLIPLFSFIYSAMKHKFFKKNVIVSAWHKKLSSSVFMFFVKQNRLNNPHHLLRLNYLNVLPVDDNNIYKDLHMNQKDNDSIIFLGLFQT